MQVAELCVWNDAIFVSKTNSICTLLFVSICVNAENGVEQPQGVKMIWDGVGIECVTQKLCDKEVMGYAFFYPKVPTP